MSYTIFREQIEQQARQLQYEQYCLYALWNMERMCSILHKSSLSQQKQFVIRASQRYLWEYFLNKIADEAMNEQLAHLEDLFMIEEDDVVALNVLICLDVAYKCVLKHQNEAYIATLYLYDTQEQLFLKSAPHIKLITQEVEEYIESLPKMQGEMNLQLLTIQYITENNYTPELVDLLKVDAAKHCLAV